MAPKTATRPRAAEAKAPAGRSTPRSSSTKTRATSRTATRWTSRAVLRTIEPGSSVTCRECGEPVKFRAKVRLQQVICNVYVKGVWDRVEHYHADCYESAGRPHGEAAAPAPTPPRRAPATP